MLYVLIADNKTARVFEFNQQENTFEKLAAFHNVELGRHERDLVSDRPGRMLDGASGIHHSYEPNDSARSRAAERWLKTIGTSLRSLLAGRPSDGLILVAAPRTLAGIRAGLPGSFRAKVRAEVQRNLVKQSQQELARSLQPTLRAATASLRRHRPAYRRVERPLGP
jgi:protein required for attachment to host cells